MSRSGWIALALTVGTVAAAAALVLMVPLHAVDERALVVLSVAVGGLAVLNQVLSSRNTAALLGTSRKQWFESAPRGLATLDRSMRIREANALVGELFGVMTADLVGTQLGTHFVEGDRAAIASQFETMLISRRSVESDHLVDLRDGSRRWIHWRASAIENGRGEFDHFLITLEDASSTHKAKQAAEANLAELEKLNRLKSDFAAMVSHEFRTALTGIQGMSELMMSDSLTAEETRDYAGHVFRESERVNRLISDMLDLDRLEATKMKMRTAPVDLNETIIDTVESLRPTSARHLLITDLDLLAGMVEGDEDRLRQVVSNLLTNAIKYSPDGGDVVIATRVSGTSLEVSVTDHGVGIPADFTDRLFGRFERYESTPSKVIGTGLGLAIARQIVEMHGGKIWVESKQGVGSTFKFTVPLSAPEPMEPRQETARAV